MGICVPGDRINGPKGDGLKWNMKHPYDTKLPRDLNSGGRSRWPTTLTIK